MKLVVKIVTPRDDLETLVDHINAAEWDEVNEMQTYAVDALRSYLEVRDTVFATCYLQCGDSRNFAGMASGRFEQKPYDFEKWLYIDEVDTCSNLRKRGAGTALMKKLLEIADENDCDEVWLGAEARNSLANSFYESLEPDSIDAVVGYTFEIDD